MGKKRARGDFDEKKKGLGRILELGRKCRGRAWSQCGLGIKMHLKQRGQELGSIKKTKTNGEDIRNRRILYGENRSNGEY